MVDGNVQPEDDYAEPRENVDGNLPDFTSESTDDHNNWQNDDQGHNRHNLGHRGERPILPSEASKHGHFHRTEDERHHGRNVRDVF